MRRGLLLAAIALVVGAIAFAVTHRMRLNCCPDEQTWFRKEFALTEAQAAEIARLRAAYKPERDARRRQITEAHQRLVALDRDGQKDTPAFAAALAEFKQLEEACAQATQKHLREIAAQMPPAEAERYLSLVRPKITPCKASTQPQP